MPLSIGLAKRSKARYQVKGQPDVPAIKKALEVYEFRKANPKMKLWEIGNLIPKLQIRNKIQAGDSRSILSDKKNILAAVVARHPRRASASIKNSARGNFP